ncbi:sugar ABC transporter ATP-binding protein [Glaciibacter psychrotolerans]|uniref:ABC-type sugar transport system ATPase subunit n=1 Tax=Glaciibacter psychrotolerans TaxID=670054 RepID=A0A7Z0EHA2_9MICO|nr:sugar ABC transporter ATP-binding protein [Leifsonia psychrotolerans]NYJ21657.1 ABC-type sugar transport system ATPase subunit [Leifsonia psychrotolerans]
MPAAFDVVGITKSFPGVKALVDVSVSVRPGEIHCWIGENGAGKSTLIKILAGAHAPDSGEILVEGRPVTISKPGDAMNAGLSFILQELSVVDGLSIADNIMLGHELRRGPEVRKHVTNQRATELLDQIGFEGLDPARLVGTLSTAEKQAVMIARALNLEARVIFLDETSATLDSDEVKRLFDVMRMLRSVGKAVVFVTHRLQEVIDVADRVTVFKDGTIVGTLEGDDIDSAIMVRAMVGRDVTQIFPPKDREVGNMILEAKSVSTREVRNISLSVRSGEVLGIAGLVGSGRTEVLRALFGLDKVTTGTIRLDGAERVWPSCQQAINSGIAMVPADRRSEGIVALRSVEENLTLTWAGRASGRGWRKKSALLAQQFVEELRIKTPSLAQHIGLLSGGNQQKVVVARWLAMKPKVLLLDEPTRGIDVGAKAEMYRLIDELARAGLAVIVVSSDLLEVIGLSNRILVMREGEPAGTLSNEPTEEAIVALAMAHEKAVI